jgi:hypothetical protein
MIQLLTSAQGIVVQINTEKQSHLVSIIRGWVHQYLQDLGT